MANINIAEWSPDQVAEWMSGLGTKLTPYVTLFKEKGVNGAKLLTLRCDDLDYLGVEKIGHQELLLEAVEHLRNFHYEVHRENLQQLAMRLSVAANSLYCELRSHQDGSKVETQTLSDVARVIAAVKPLVCWLDRSPFTETSALADRKSALLKLSLEAATCAQRDRFAEHPTRAIAAAAATIVTLADYIIRDVQDPMILQPASVVSASWTQGTKPLGLSILPSFCGHHQVADIRFGSPAHAAGHLEEGDEIVQVGTQAVVGWSGGAIAARCGKVAGARSGELSVGVRRRATRRAPTRPAVRQRREYTHLGEGGRRPPWERDLYEFKRELGLLRNTSRPVEEVTEKSPEEVAGGHSSDESEALSPPASPTQLTPDTRLYLPPPRTQIQRRNTISGGSPTASRRNVAIQQFWQELRNQKSFKHTGSAQLSDEDEISNSLYRRDKSVSYSTGLEISPRPKTCLGVGTNNHKKHNEENELNPTASPNKNRGKLDKSHSTPAYDFGNTEEPGSLVTQIIPESPSTPTDSPTILVHSAEKADQILDFKKYSSQIGEAILQQQHKHNNDDKMKFVFTEKTELHDKEKLLETINIAMLERQNNEKKLTNKSTFKLQTTFGENGETTTTKTFFGNEQVKAIQNELVQAINEQRQQPKPKMSEIPPAPPPRPLSTQKPIVRETYIPIKDPRTFPLLIPVKPENENKEISPLKPIKQGDAVQISLPLKHITKYDVQIIQNDSKKELLPLNYDSNLNLSQLDISKSSSKTSNLNVMSNPDLTCMSSSISECHSLHKMDSSLTLSPMTKTGTLSPPASVVRNIFPSKSKGLKKKNSLLIKRRSIPLSEVQAVYCSAVVQRVRARGTIVWASRILTLTAAHLLAYRHAQSTKADCLIFLNGFTVSAATEVKSKPFAFKVYHTGTAVYFAVDTAEDRAVWIHHITRATLAHGENNSLKGCESKNFSETDYSDESSDKEDKPSDSKKDTTKDKEKDKSKFGSLKKLTHRMHRSESQENVSHSSTSLDRKYLRFFSRSKNKDENKNKDEAKKAKHNVAPVPTEHYRSYRRVPQPQYTQTEQTKTTHNIAKIKKIDPLHIPDDEELKSQKKIPKPLNYIHASNPNLLDFEKSDFVTKPSIPLPKSKSRKPDNFAGLITLEEFMLKEQEQERQQVYSNRVLMGIEKDKKEERASSKKAAKELQKQWEKIIPDVIYGELPTYDEQNHVIVEQIQSRSLPKTPEILRKKEEIKNKGKPISIKGKDGYEKIVYTLPSKPVESDEPPKVLPRKPKKPDKSSDLTTKSTTITAKDLGYEVIYDEKENDKAKRKSKDLGYETVYGEKPRRSSEDIPPKIMPKSRQVLNRQNSLNRNSGVDMSPVFVQGESPEKFWLNSLRRNDKVHTNTHTNTQTQHSLTSDRPKPLKSATQYTPISLPLSGGAGLATAPHLQISLDVKEVGSTVESPSRGGISRLRQMFTPPTTISTKPRAPPPTPDTQPQNEDNEDWCLRLSSPESSQYPHLQCPPTFQPETYSLTDKAFVKNPDDK